MLVSKTTCRTQRYIITGQRDPEQIVKPRNLNQNDRLVLTALDGAARPLSAYDILEKTRSSSIKAPTQVYRSLQKLEGQGLVHRIEALSAFVA